MPGRKLSLARLGIGAELEPRLTSLGWIADGRLGPGYEPMVRLAASGPDPEGTLNRLAALAERNPSIDLVGHHAELVALAGCSRALWDALLRYPEWPPSRSRISPSMTATVQLEMAAIAVDDLLQRADFSSTVAALSDLADRVAEDVLGRIRSEFAHRHGEVHELPFAIIAMGKWGGRELNYSSDIDLLFVYEPGPIAADRAREIAVRIASAFIARLSGILRVDADLRPEGRTGPLVRSLRSYRAYYQKWGEHWEFQALLKARASAGDRDLGTRFETMAHDFAWPPSLDPELIRDLRHLKVKAEGEAAPNDIKRAAGGIRDVEFSVQLLQMIHGRHDPELRVAGTLPALTALCAGGYVHEDDASALADSYRWLRTVEHRLQLWNLTQTHRLPDDREGRVRIAKVMGYRQGGALEAFEEDLGRHRASVRRLHERLYYRPLLEAYAASPGILAPEAAAERLTALGFRDSRGAARAFAELTAGLSRKSRLMEQMLPLMLEWFADTPNPDLGLEQLRLLVGADVGVSEMVGSLRDRPLAAQRLCRLLGSSRLVGNYIDRIPEFLPELAEDGVLLEGVAEPSRVVLQRLRLRQDRAARHASLLRFVRRRLLRIAALDLLGQAGADQTMKVLTETADAAAAGGIWIAERETGPVELSVIAMGSWGGAELGYGSDLDVLFVFADGADPQRASRHALEFTAALGGATPEDIAYRVDTRLRPEGKQGPLARSLDAYRTYYLRWAEPWEMLALARARPVAGSEEVAAGFRALVEERIYQAPPSSQIIRAIRGIKARVEKERIPPGEDPDFHLKLGRGGLSDIEFLTQLLQLRHGHLDPLVRESATIRVLPVLAELGALRKDEAAILLEAYRFATLVRNRLYLQTGRPVDSFPTDPLEVTRLAMSLDYPHRAALREEYRRVTRRARRVFERRFYEDQPNLR
jgi:glutamate-ammonia-ligase adenylyltransferase